MSESGAHHDFRYGKWDVCSVNHPCSSSTSGNPPLSSLFSLRICQAEREWREKTIEQEMDTDSRVATYLVRLVWCGMCNAL